MPLPVESPMTATTTVDNYQAVAMGQQLPFEAPTVTATPGKLPAVGIDETLARIALTGDPKAVLGEQVASQLASRTEQWLNRFGQARVNLSFDKQKFSLSQAEIMGLFPLEQQAYQLLFTQLGLHHQHSLSTTLNLGIGQRHIVNYDWLLGYNLFYDVRLQQRHQRLGLGVEARRDYLALTINGYMPLSDWKVVDKAPDQLARPARAVDLIVDAYLPHHPQLGGRVSAERYFDQQIGAFDANRLNPKPAQSFSLGIHYTPVPLLQVGYHYTLGQCPVDKGKQQLQLTANYQLGVPLRQQLESSHIAQLRTLRGSLLEPVQRHHQVVLAYKAASKEKIAQKAAQVTLQLPQDEIGNIGEKLSIPLNLSGDHKLRFHGSLGQVAQFSNGNLIVTLPHQVGQYDLQVEVLDQQDQRVVLSNRMTVQVFDVSATVMRTAREIRTSGSWNNAGGAASPYLLVRTPIWPAGAALEVWIHQNGKLVLHNYVHYVDEKYVPNDSAQSSKRIRLYHRPGHWMVLDRNENPFDPTSAPGSTGGDCFYNAALSELRQHGIQRTVPELRSMMAQVLLENPGDPHIAP